MSTLSQKIECVIKLMDLLHAESAETRTPTDLVNDMLDKLPTEIWQDRTKTFLDPACGRGIFGLLILQRLFDGLQSVIPDEQERLSHILREQIWMCDISKVMCMKAKAAFSRAIKATGLVNPGVHIYDKDSLEHKFNMKFDVVIGNPPYNPPTESAGGAGGRTNLWKKFVERAIDFQLRDGGILCIIHPPTWRAPFSNLKKSKVSSLWKKITVENKLLFLQMLKQPFPGVGTRADFYILQREPSPPKFITDIVDINGVTQRACLQDSDFLPNEDFDFVYSMTAAEPDDCLKVIFNSTLYDPRAKHVSKTADIDFKFPILHATNKAGNRFFWANTKRLGHYGIRKLMFGDSGINNVLFDTDGSYACSNHCIGIDVSELSNEDAMKLRDWLVGEDCNRIVKATLLSSFGLSADLFTKIRKDCWKQSKEINDKDT